MFDARTAKQLAPGAHLTIDGCPGLRLEATAQHRTWTYRYKSPIDGRMKQVKLGRWPEVALPAALAAWERARKAREAGADPAGERRQARVEAAAAASAERAAQRAEAYTVRRLAADYLAGHVKVHRKKKGADEVKRMFDTMLATVADEPAATLTRSQAFDLLELHAGIPVQAAKLRTELGAAWDYALDAGRLPDSAPNWWRQVMRGRLRSKGHRIAGKRVTAKRVLREPEVAALVRWLPNFSRNVADVLTLYLWTGARGAELVQMEAHEVTDEADGLWWTCPKVKTKNARHEAASDLRVPLLGEAERVVRRRLGVHPKGWLFPAARGAGHLEQKAVQTAVHFRQPYSKTRPKDERPRLPVTHWAPHDLRRTVRTMLASMGCPDTVAEAVLGHMQPGVQGVYNLHQYDRERRLWLGKLSDRLQALAS